MSISDSLAALRGVRDAIRVAIVGKGGSLPVGSPMGSYAQAISNLPSGSGGGGGGSVEIPFRSRLTIPGDTDTWHLTSLTTTGVPTYAFYQDNLLTTVSLPAATSLGTNAFQGCTSLTSADFPLVTSLGTYAFQNCSSLTAADFPAVTSISDYAFRYCAALTSADFPLATSLGANAFYGCSALTAADFPLVTSIGTQAFRDCSALTSLTLSKNQVATLSSTTAFTNTPIASGTGYIYVPDNLVDQYKTATNWKTYANQILPLSQKP